MKNNQCLSEASLLQCSQKLNPSTKIASLLSELTDTEVAEIDMRFWGDIILKKARNLSLRVTTELLTPISAWIDDEDWLEKYNDSNNKTIPDWANYKGVQTMEQTAKAIGWRAFEAIPARHQNKKAIPEESITIDWQRQT